MTLSKTQKTIVLLLSASVLPLALVPISYYSSIMSYSLFDGVDAVLGLVPEFPGSGQIRLVLLISFYLVPSILLISQLPWSLGLRTITSILFCVVFAPPVIWLLFMLPCVERSHCL